MPRATLSLRSFSVQIQLCRRQPQSCKHAQAEGSQLHPRRGRHHAGSNNYELESPSLVYDHTHARHFFSQALLSGPISVVIEVYNDFLEYSSGVYIPNKGSGLVGPGLHSNAFDRLRCNQRRLPPEVLDRSTCARARVFFVFHHARLTCFFADVGRVIR